MHEDQVPELKVTVTVATYPAVRAPTAYLRALVKDYFGAGPAGAGIPHGPEVVCLPQAHDPFSGKARNLLPEGEGLVIVPVNRDVEAFHRELEFLGEEFPGIGDGLFLEVVPKGEVPEHLEEGMVPGGVAHVFKVVVFAPGPHTLLARGGPFVRPLFLPQKDLLELDHPSVGEKEGGVVSRHQGGARDDLVPFTGEIFEKETPYLFSFQVTHAGLLMRVCVEHKPKNVA